jgi:hypothetical protein
VKGHHRLEHPQLRFHSQQGLPHRHKTAVSPRGTLAPLFNVAALRPDIGTQSRYLKSHALDWNTVRYRASDVYEFATFDVERQEMLWEMNIGKTGKYLYLSLYMLCDSDIARDRIPA